MRRHRLLVPFALASVGMAVACNAIIGLDNDYDLGADAAAPGSSTSSSGSDARVTDGPATTTLPDGRVVDEPDGTAPDAVADVFVPPDAPYDALYPNAFDRDGSARDAAIPANTEYCAPPVTGANPEWYCWNFSGTDAITVTAGGWAEVDADGGTNTTVGALDTPPRALDSVVTFNGGNASSALLIKPLNSPALGVNELILSFSFRVLRAETTARIATIGLFGTEYGLGVYGTASCFGASCLGEIGAANAQIAQATPFDTSVWYRGQVDLLRSGSTWAGTVTVGGHVVAHHDSAAIPDRAGLITGLTVNVGAFETEFPLGTTEMQMDDILLQVR